LPGQMLSLGPNDMLEAELQRAVKFFEDFLEITLREQPNRILPPSVEFIIVKVNARTVGRTSLSNF